MSLRRIAIAPLAALALVAASMIGVTGAASGAPAAVGTAAAVQATSTTIDPRVLFTFPADEFGQFPESVIADSKGNLFVSVTAWRGDGSPNVGQIWKITPRGVATKFGPELEVGMLTGLALDDHGRLYVGHTSFGDPSLRPSGVLRVDANSATQVLDVSAMDAVSPSMPNGLAFYDGVLYVSDAWVGAIWRTRPNGNSTDVQQVPWMQDPLLAPSLDWIGVNGIAVDDSGLQAVVYDTGLVVRIPISRNGAAGAPEVLASSPELVTGDGVTLARDGSLWVATNGGAAFEGGIVRVSPHGHVSVIVQNPGWLDYPTQVVFGTTRATQDSLYIANGAMNNDKGNANVIAWHLDGHH